MTDAEFIYARWHEAARSRDVPALLALYAEDAELESPLVPVILNRASGVLRGHAQIREFLEEGTRRRPNELVRWHRDGRFSERRRPARVKIPPRHAIIRLVSTSCGIYP